VVAAEPVLDAEVLQVLLDLLLVLQVNTSTCHPDLDPQKFITLKKKNEIEKIVYFGKCWWFHSFLMK
jgi:hypothetical protein